MKVVLDSNILVICLTSRYPWHFLYQALMKGKFELAVSTEIVFEYKEIISRKYNHVTPNAFVALLNELPNVSLVEPFYKWHLINTDPDDNKYCDCTIASQSHFLVTEDNHFSILKTIPFPQIHVLSLEEFAQKIKAETSNL